MDQVSCIYPGTLPYIPEDDCGNHVKSAIYYLGSCLTEPFCAADEYKQRIYTVDALNPDSWKCTNVARKFFLVVGMLGWGILGVLTTLPGLALRGLAAALEENPFTYAKGDNPSDQLGLQKTVSMLTWNVCFIGAGYAISDGGVTSPNARFEAVVQKIKETNADVNCLNEVFDVILAQRLKDHLMLPENGGYNHFYYNIGARALGVSSGLFVASRYEIHDPEFIPFTSSTGRASYSEKGVFSFTIADSSEGQLTRIHVTHLQFSEKPADAAPEEVQCRSDQMQQIKTIADLAAEILPRQVVTGDLNMDDEELNSLEFFKDFSRGNVLHTEKTWAGDTWCATHIAGKTPSEAINLDYTLGLNVEELTTDIAFDILFDPGIFSSEALSDHRPLLSTWKVS